MVGQIFKELGGSEYYKLKGFLGKTVPKVEPNRARETFEAITDAIDLGLVKACHDLSEGGLAVAAAEMAFAGGYGIEFDLRKVPRQNVNRNDFVLFSESNSRVLVEVSEKARQNFEALMNGKVCAELGRVTKTPRLCVHGLNSEVVVEAYVSDLLVSWKRPLSRGV